MDTLAGLNLARYGDTLGPPPPPRNPSLDVMYEDELARRVTDWLLRLSLEGCVVLVGDPGRHFLDKARLEQIGSYPLPPELRDENYGLSEGGVWTVKTPRRPRAG